MYYIFYFISGLLLIAGSFEDKPVLIAYAQFFLCTGYIVQHYIHHKFNYIHPVILYGLIGVLTSLSHIIGFTTDNPLYIKDYFDYASEDHLTLSMEIFYWGSCFIFTGFHVGTKNRSSFFSTIYYSLPSGFSYKNYTYFLVFLFIINTYILPMNLGYISAIIQLLPLVSIFFMARKGSQEKNQELLNLCLPLVVILTIHSVFFSYLRSEMLQPSIAYLLGIVIGSSSLKPLKAPHLYPIYLFLSFFLIFFNTFGEIRENSGLGLDRITSLQQKKEEKELNKEKQSSPIIRLSLINQLSQVGKVVEEDGFYEGKTLTYFAYVFIPRIIWPDKPRIAQGAWFAYRIGQARMLAEEVYSNSINMTVPGELYLNFGWMGIVIGCILFGYFIAQLWNASLFWEGSNNFMGTIFALFLFMIAINQMGADLQILITLIAVYITFVVASKILNNAKA